METYRETQEMKRSVWSLLFVFIAGSALIPVLVSVTDGDRSWQELWPAPVLVSLVIVFFMLLKLVTTIDEKGIRVSFGFLSRKGKYYAWEQIKHAQVRKYEPLMEYGGWGYRVKPWKKKRAYSISGDIGLELTLQDGSLVMIGTKKQEELKNYLHYLHTKYGIEALKDMSHT